MKKMSGKRTLLSVLLGAAIALAACGSARAADVMLRTTTYAVTSHYTNDKSDYGVEPPRYWFTYFDFDAYTTDPAMSFKIKNGNYSYRLWLAGADTAVANRDETFRTVEFSRGSASDGTPYVNYGLFPQSYTGADPREEMHFVSENSGLAGKEYEVAFVSGETAAGTIPVWRTLSEQMASYVPHVEIVRDAAGKPVAVRCSIVNPENPGVPLRKAAGGAPNVTDFWDVRLYNGDTWIRLVNARNINYDDDATTRIFGDGDELSATFYVTNDVSLPGASSDSVSMRYGEGRINYRWNFNEANVNGQAEKLLPIAPLPYDQNDYCGEVCIDEALRYLGKEVSQRAINEAGGGNGVVGLENRSMIETSLKNLGIRYEAWGDESLSYDEHIGKIKQQIDLGHPVLVGVKINPTSHPNWYFDHYMLIIGYTADGFIYNSPSSRETRTFEEFRDGNTADGSGYTLTNDYNTFLGVSFISAESSPEDPSNDPTPTPSPTPDNSGSGGGCNAGSAAGILLLGACAFLKKR